MTIKNLIKRNTIDLYNDTKLILLDKYYNMYLSKYKASKGIEAQALRYILKKFWYEGKICAFEKLGDIYYAPFAEVAYNMYDMPIEINAINVRGVQNIFPSHSLLVDKDTIIGYATETHLPVKTAVKWYTDRIAQVEILISNNLAMQNMPFLLKGDNKNINKIQDLIGKVLAGEIVIYTDKEITQDIEVMQTATPFLIKELYNYKMCLENELLTLLGLNNNPVEKPERLITDEVNANNQVIDYNDNIQHENIIKFFNAVNTLFNKDIVIINQYDIIKEKEADTNDSKQDNR